LQVAWSVVADWPAPLNLLRARNRQASKAVLARAAVVAGMAAGLGAGLGIEHSRWWRSTAPTPVAPTVVKAPSPAAVARATVRSERWPPLAGPAIAKTLLATLRSGS
jgi:hypothetical protein